MFLLQDKYLYFLWMKKITYQIYLRRINLLSQNWSVPATSHVLSNGHHQFKMVNTRWTERILNVKHANSHAWPILIVIVLRIYLWFLELLVQNNNCASNNNNTCSILSSAFIDCIIKPTTEKLRLVNNEHVI